MVDSQVQTTKAFLALPTPFLRTYRTLPSYRWWKPILALLLAAVFTIAFTVTVVFAFMFMQLTIDPQTLFNDLNHGKFLGIGDDGSYLGTDLTNPLAMSMLLLSAASMLPAAGLAALVTGLGGFRTISSVEGKLRPDVFKKLGPWVFGLTLVVFMAQLLLSLAEKPNGLGPAQVAPLALLVIVLFTPLQCAAEEYLFRGLLMQSLGSWTPIAVMPVVLQAIVFASMHSYNVWGVLDIFVAGICFGLLAAKTGGLEAGILFHSANNVFLFVLGSLFASQAAQSDITVVGFVFDAATTMIITALILWIAKRKGLLVDDAQFEEAILTHGVAVAQPTPMTSVAASYCHECGTGLQASAKFCPECGTPVCRPREEDLCLSDN